MHKPSNFSFSYVDKMASSSSSLLPSTEDSEPCLSSWKSSIILYDGICIFCNSCVHFVKRFDVERKFGLLPLQSTQGQELMRSLGRNCDDLSSVVYIRALGRKSDNVLFQDKANVYVFEKSDAAIRVVEELFKVPPVIVSVICTVFPKRLRDCVYDLVARNRYSIMGKRSDCGCHAPSDVPSK